MSCLVNPYVFAAGGAGFALTGALVRKNTGQTNPNPAIYQIEVYDLTGLHDTTTDTSRITIPTGEGGAPVRVVSSLRHTSENNMTHFQLKNGASFVGRGFHRPISTGAGTRDSNGFINNITSAIIVPADNDYFEHGLTLSSGTTTPTDHGCTFHSLEFIDPTLKRVLLAKNADQALAATMSELTWETETYDEGGWHSGSDAEAIVPSGVTRVRATANIYAGSAGSSLLCRILVNGSPVRGSGYRRTISNTNDAQNLVSAVFAVTPGDAISVEALHGTAGTLCLADDQTWMCVEEIPAGYQCALLYRSSGTHSVTNTEASVAWTDALYDDGGGFDFGTSATDYVVPAGVDWMRQSFNIVGSSVTNSLTCRGLLNGVNYYGAPGASSDDSGVELIGALGAWVPVTPGDVVTLGATSTTSRTIGTDNETWMCVEFRGS